MIETIKQWDAMKWLHWMTLIEIPTQWIFGYDWILINNK